MIVHDIRRPDVNGTPPKMQAICDAAEHAVAGLAPHLKISTDDNLMSSVEVRGAMQPKEQWSGGIFHNADYFIVSISPPDGKRYYDPADDRITMRLVSAGRNLPKMRKVTASVTKVIAKLKTWLETAAAGAKA